LPKVFFRLTKFYSMKWIFLKHFKTKLDIIYCICSEILHICTQLIENLIDLVENAYLLVTFDDMSHKCSQSRVKYYSVIWEISWLCFTYHNWINQNLLIIWVKILFLCAKNKICVDSSVTYNITHLRSCSKQYIAETMWKPIYYKKKYKTIY
jgi:hypothetical protein